MSTVDKKFHVHMNVHGKESLLYFDTCLTTDLNTGFANAWFDH